jgi:hypothetical protein
MSVEAATAELQGVWDECPPSGSGICVYAEEVEHFLQDTGRTFDWLLRASVHVAASLGLHDNRLDNVAPHGAAAAAPARGSPPPPVIAQGGGGDTIVDGTSPTVQQPLITDSQQKNAFGSFETPAAAAAPQTRSSTFATTADTPIITGIETFPSHKLPKLKIRSPVERLNLPLMFFVFDPISPATAQALTGLHHLRFAHGQRLAVFPFDGVPTQKFETKAGKIKAHGTREIKRRWMLPFTRFSLETRPKFAITFQNPSATVVARNAMTQLVHVDPDRECTWTFAIWSRKQGGEWAMPGGKVDLGDESLEHTASREFREECPGFTLDEARLHGPENILVHYERNDPRVLPDGSVPAGCSWKYPCNAHLVVRADPAFFAATVALQNADGVGRFSHIDALGALAFASDSTGEQLRAFHATPDALIIEHEFFTWLPLPKGGPLTAAHGQVPPGHNGPARIRREAVNREFTRVLQGFAATFNTETGGDEEPHPAVPPLDPKAAPFQPTSLDKT